MKDDGNNLSELKVAAGSRAMQMASYALIGSIIGFLMTGVSFVLVTRILGPTQYGIYTLAIAFGAIFGSIGNLAIGSALTKYISAYRQSGMKRKVNEIVSSSLFLVGVSGFVIGSLCILFSGTISQYVFQTQAYATLIKFVAVEIVAFMFFGVFFDALIGCGNGKHVAIVAGVDALVQASVSIFLAFEGFGALAPIIGLIAAYLTGFLLGVYILRVYDHISFTKPSLRSMKKVLSFSVPLALSNIGSNLASSAALIFLGYFVLASVIGNVGITSKTGALVGVIFSSISTALLPAFSAALSDKKLKNNIGRMYGYAVYLAIALVGPLLFYMATFSAPFSYFVFGGNNGIANYTYAPLYISIMCIGLLLGVAGSFASNLLVATNKVVSVFKYNVIINVIILLLVVGLVPKFGSVAYVLLAFLISPVLIDIFLIKKLGTMFKIDFRIGKILRLVVADVVVSAVAASMYLLFGGVVLLLSAVVVYILLYPIVAALLKGADNGDVNTIKALSKSIPFVGWILRVFMDYAAVVVK